MVIEDGHVPALPGEVPGKPPNLKDVTDGVVNRNRQDGEFMCPKQKLKNGHTKVHTKFLPLSTDIQLQSSEILEELENEGIIPVGQRGSAAGQAYSIMVGACHT